jgi:putative nucleotidyltransferase with HDIG domain
MVEDNLDDALLTIRVLRRGGFEPVYQRVDNKRDLISALQQENWEIVISDYSMPQFNGLDALKIVMEHGLEIPFIIISGNIGEETAVAAMKAGAHDYIMKGNLARLVPAVERELREAEVRRARKRAERQVYRVNRALRVLSECNQIQMRATNEQELLQDICRLIIESGGYRFCWIGAAEQTEERLIKPLAYFGEENGYLDQINISWDNQKANGQGPSSLALLNQQPVTVQDIRKQSDLFINIDTALERGFASMIALPVIHEDLIFGIIDIYSGEANVFDEQEVSLLGDMASDLAFGIQMLRVRADRDRAEKDMSEAYDLTIEGWARALELRDGETEGHSQRVVKLTVDMASKMGIPEEDLTHVRRGALLHDIGKMGLPDSILLKPGPLTEYEWEVMRMHPIYAYRLLSPIKFLQKALEIPYSHHEKWDGSGYPRGLKGEDIPLGARIFAVIDVWDALISDRPYRKRWSTEQTCEYINSQSGKHFDPQVVEVFFQMINTSPVLTS